MSGRLQPATVRGHAALAGCLACLVFGYATVEGGLLPCAGSLSLDHTDRIFDGARIEIAVLRGESVSLATDTFGPWIPLEQAVAGTSIVFRHRTLADTRLSLCVVPRSEAPASEASWKDYTNALPMYYSPEAEIVELKDSANDITTCSALGLHSREILLRRMNETGDKVLAERQVLAIGKDVALLFAVSTPESALGVATSDLWFFLSRLERQ